jgi:hypothetical protein
MSTEPSENFKKLEDQLNGYLQFVCYVTGTDLKSSVCKENQTSLLEDIAIILRLKNTFSKMLPSQATVKHRKGFDSLLVAKILSPKTNGYNVIGTAYPISKDLIITARHVVDFAERDVDKPISIIWTDILDGDEKPYTVEVSQMNIVFNGGEKYDVVLIRCALPANVDIPPLLGVHPVEHQKWKSMGFPQVGKEEDGLRHKISAMGEIFPPDKNNSILHLASLNDARENNAWMGMAGAPVFSGEILIAVITGRLHDFKDRFLAVSIPYLLANEIGFRKAVGYYPDRHLGSGSNL